MAAEYILGYWLVETIESVSVQENKAGAELPHRFVLGQAVGVVITDGCEYGINPFVVASEVVTARYLKAASNGVNLPEHHHSSGCECQPPPTHEVQQAGWAGGWDSRSWDSSSPVSGICIQVTTETV